MRIVAISGILSYYNPVLPRLARTLQRKLPGSTIAFEEDSYCGWYEIARMRRFIDELCRKYDDGVPTLLIGHSLGGLYACAVAGRLVHTNVACIVTVCSPHRFPVPGIQRLFGTDAPENVPIVSFGGTRDRFVPWGTRHPRAKAHRMLNADHFEDIAYRQEHADVIAQVTVDTLSRPGR